MAPDHTDFMKNRLKMICDAFTEEKHGLQDIFYDENDVTYALCANMLVTRGLVPDAQSLAKCREILCRRATMFSTFRGIMEAPVSCLMYAAADPKRMLNKLVYVHTVLDEYFRDSHYLVYAASVLMEFPDEMTEGLAYRAKRIYDLMESMDYHLTSYEDQVLCVLFAASGREAEDLLYEAEYIYKKLDCGYNNSIQSASHILTLADGQPDNKCKLYRDIQSRLDERDMWRFSYSGTILLAALTSVCRSANDAVNDIIDAYYYLRDKEPGGKWLRLLLGDHDKRLANALLTTTLSYAPVGRDLTGSLAVTAAEYALLYITDQL